MLGVYSAGLGIPFLLVAAFTDRLAYRSRRLGHTGRWLHKGAGAIMVVMGLLMAPNSISALSYWMLDVFPVLGRLLYRGPVLRQRFAPVMPPA